MLTPSENVQVLVNAYLRRPSEQKYIAIESALKRMILSLALMYTNRDNPVRDLEQEGRIGIHEALLRYRGDPRPFVTVARNAMRERMQRVTRANTGAVHMPHREPDENYPEYYQYDEEEDAVEVDLTRAILLNQMLSAIDADDRRLFLGYHYHGYDQKSLAIEYSTDQPSISRRLQRIAAELRTIAEERGISPELMLS